VNRSGQLLLEKYLLSRRIGKGGMGEVWAGEHTLTGRRVAVKILGESHLANAKVVARFGREARAASAVHHPGIVEILDQDVTPSGEPFLVMEYLEGESLGDRLKRVGKLSEDETAAIVLPLLDALAAAHTAGVVHRDLKPDNVYLTPGERGKDRVKIVDFGISRKADEIANHLTQEGSVLGTPHYMSPEQARGEVNIDGRVDVYATGVLTYECLTGKVPFDAKNYNALLQRILGETPALPSTRGASVSSAFETAVLHAMAKAKRDRPASAAELRDEFIAARKPATIPGGERARLARSAPSAASMGLTQALEDALGGVPAIGTLPAHRMTPEPALAATMARETQSELSVTTIRQERSPHAETLSGTVARESDLQVLPRSGAPRAASEAPGVDGPGDTPSSQALVLDAQGVREAKRGATFAGHAHRRASERPSAPHAKRTSAPHKGAFADALLDYTKATAGWVLAALAIALLAYTGRLVFARQDLRHPRANAQDTPGSNAAEAPSSEAGNANDP
jgi:serine/threonine protein kinase